MSKTAVITARIDPETLAALDQLGAASDRSRAWLIAQAVERYTKEETAFRAFLQEGIDDLDAGRVYSQEEVEAMFAAEVGRRAA